MTPFKAYDIRGKVPEQLDEQLAVRIGRAFAHVVQPKQVVVGHDVRSTSRMLTDALTRGLRADGVDVVDIGLCGTEEVYFATSHLGLDGGIMVTASHNPMGYNGMKLVREHSRPISGDSGLRDIERLAVAGDFGPEQEQGGLRRADPRADFVDFLMAFAEPKVLEPLRIVSNPGNGCAGPLMEQLCAQLPFEIIPVHHQPDGSFPNGIPNPLLPENRAATADAVRASGAHMGVAWDGDFDRCFLFDENANFIEGYYIVGLLAERMLALAPGAKIIHDPRLVWNTVQIVEEAGGVPIQSKTGHAFIKERMREENAVYGGEMSAHHYFREFFYCDSGMIPWLLVAKALCTSGRPLSELVAERQAAYPSSGEINTRLADPDAAITAVRRQFGADALSEEEVDGLSLEFAEWRLNLRKSNTEPLLRLNVESRGDAELMRRQTDAVLEVIGRFA
jgi:phosphomannomutase